MLRECITDEEYRALDDYRDDYMFMGSCNDGSRKDTIQNILYYWEENKVNLFNLLGKKLQLTKEISYTRSSEETIKEIYKLNSRYSDWTFGRECRSGNRFITSWFNWVETSFSSMIEQERELRYNLQGLVNNAVDLANNSYSGTSFEVPLPNGKKYVVSKGCKVLRALNKISSAYNVPGFEDFRICHSLIMNDGTLKGKLTLSIHPLDYWTMSDNECDWTSCMSWSDFGAYRMGTVEMMNSPYVVVAYLSAAEPIEIGCNDLPWSNKKWRQLFIVDKNFVMGIKSYPYQNDYLTKEICKWIAELAKGNLGWTYGEEFPYYQSNAIFDKNNEVMFKPINFYTNKMYNDVGCCEKHWMLLNRSSLTEDGIPFSLNFSGETECMFCGSTDEDYLDGSESALCCSLCETTRRCCCCDSIITDDDEYYIVNDEYYCYNCYCEQIITCSECEEEVLTDDITALYVVLNKQDEDLTIYTSEINLCPDCYSNLKSTVPIYNNYYVYIEDIREKQPDLIPSFLQFDDLENLPSYLIYHETHDYWDQSNADLVDSTR